MNELFLTSEQLAARWHLNSATLNQWRCNNRGPRYVKMNGRVLYELYEIKKFEEAKRSQEMPKNKRRKVG
jgi:hypothetical protein